MHRCAPVRFVLSTASQSSSFMRSASVSRVIAALFTSMSSLPNFASVCRKPDFTCAGSATSIGTASASPPAASISATSDASLSAVRAATATFAPAPASATEVARPIPCEAPVTRATLSLSENMRLAFRRFGARLRDLVERGLETRGVLDIEAAHRAVNLPQQAGEYFARSDFDEDVNALLDHFAHGLEPADRHGHLTNQRFARFLACGDFLRIHVGDDRKMQRAELHRAQILIEALLRRRQKRAMKGRGDGQNYGALGAGLRGNFHGTFHGRRAAGDHGL